LNNFEVFVQKLKILENFCLQVKNEEFTKRKKKRKKERDFEEEEVVDLNIVEIRKKKNKKKKKRNNKKNRIKSNSECRQIGSPEAHSTAIMEKTEECRKV